MSSTTRPSDTIIQASNDTLLIRSLDITLSITCLIFAIPLMILVTILIMTQSKGNPFFTQERLGLRKQPFILIKFRTMKVDAEKNGPEWSRENDTRITSLGRFLRKTRLDELPQLFNVLRGEMSFIGPRPIRSHFADILEDINPSYKQRFLLKPGLTGWAQIYAPYGSTTAEQLEKLPYDLKYENQLSISHYFLILLLTIKVVFMGKGI